MPPFKIAYLFKNSINNHNHFRHLRNIFTLNNKLYNIQYLFFNSNKNDIINSSYYKLNNINIENIILLDNDLDKSLNLLNSFDIIILCMAPSIFNIFGNKNKNNIQYIENKINPKIKKFYIHHGLSPILNLKELEEKNIGRKNIIRYKYLSNIWNKYNYTIITCCQKYYNFLHYCELKESNLIKINSLPQFDLNKIYYDKSESLQDSIII